VLGEPTVHLHLLAIRRIADSRGGIHTLQRYGGRLAGVIIVYELETQAGPRYIAKLDTVRI